MKRKELEAQITEMVENFQPNNFKQKAFEELGKLTKKKDINSYSSIRFILNDYPDYDSVCFKISQPGKFIIKFHINPNELKGNKKAIKKLAKYFSRNFKI